jgi:hypothetical protein
MTERHVRHSLNRPGWRASFEGSDSGLALGVVLAEELRRLGRTLRKPGFLKDRRDIGVRGEALPACLIPVEDCPNPVALFGSRKTCDPLQPCCFRFSAPFVEEVFQKRSKSPIFAVARTNFRLLCGKCLALLRDSPRSIPLVEVRVAHSADEAAETPGDRDGGW